MNRYQVVYFEAAMPTPHTILQISTREVQEQKLASMILNLANSRTDSDY